MTTYRCLFIDSSNRAVEGANVICAGSDSDAIGFAIAQLDASPFVAVEIWHGSRCIAHRPRLEFA